MKIFDNKQETKTTSKPPDILPCKEDFSHIHGDAEDFIFSFTDNKKHSEK